MFALHKAEAIETKHTRVSCDSNESEGGVHDYMYDAEKDGMNFYTCGHNWIVDTVDLYQLNRSLPQSAP